MEQILDRLCSHLDKNNYKYDRTETVSGCGAVRVRFRAHNLDMVELHILADLENTNLALRCFDVCRVPKDQMARMEHCLNELNRRRRWYHFYIDEEGGVVAACDAVVAPGTAGPVGMELILRGVDAVDESYPILMKALWSGKE